MLTINCHTSCTVSTSSPRLHQALDCSFTGGLKANKAAETVSKLDAKHVTALFLRKLASRPARTGPKNTIILLFSNAGRLQGQGGCRECQQD